MINMDKTLIEFDNQLGFYYFKYYFLKEKKLINYLYFL